MPSTCNRCGQPCGNDAALCQPCRLDRDGDYYRDRAAELNDSEPSMAADRAYLPWPARGFEVVAVRDWRDSVRRRHAAAEGVAT